MWKKGSVAAVTSFSEVPSSGPMSSCMATRFRCVSITPLGAPVVPLEYGSATTSRAGSMATSGGEISIVLG